MPRKNNDWDDIKKQVSAIFRQESLSENKDVKRNSILGGKKNIYYMFIIFFLICSIIIPILLGNTVTTEVVIEGVKKIFRIKVEKQNGN